MSDHSTPENATPFVYVPDLYTAATESAAKINVAIRLLGDHDCAAAPEGSEQTEYLRDTKHDDGYDLSVLRDILEGIRNSLLDAAAADGSERKAGAR